MLFTQFSALGDQKTNTFEPKSAKNAIRTRFFARCAKNHGIYNVFCTWPFKNIGIYSVFATFHVVVFQRNTCKNIVFYNVFALQFAKKCFKNGPKTVHEDRLSRPVIFWRISVVFWLFFDPPKITKKRQNTSSMKDFNENSLFLQNWKSSRCKIAQMEARASFFKVTFKKHREGGAGGAGSTPGSKLA